MKTLWRKLAFTFALHILTRPWIVDWIQDNEKFAELYGAILDLVDGDNSIEIDELI